MPSTNHRLALRLSASLLSLCYLALLTTAPAQAGLNWHDNSLSLLRGSNFKVNPEQQTTLTFEHASGWQRGDLYLFVDYSDYSDGGSNTYGEISPRFNLAELTGLDLSAGPIKASYLALTHERGEGDIRSNLYGLGFDIQLPVLSYLKLNLYKIKRKNHAGNGTQMTTVWALPFNIGNQQFIFDGFADWVIDGVADEEPHLHVNPQLKWQLDKLIKGLHLGTELDYWHNKYGIKDSPAFKTDQFAYSLLLRWHF
jgi:nucleoside-specific outer membrane channel protein Tsx